MKKISLRQKLIVGLLLLGGTISLLTSALQLYWTYQNELTAIRGEMDIAEHSALPLLRAAMWSLDENQARLVLDGIVAMPHTSGARVSGETIQLTSGQIPRPGQATLSRLVSIEHVYQGSRHTLGSLELYASLHPVRQKMLGHAGLVFFINALYTLAVALMVGLLFDRLVMRHVRRVAKYLESTPYIGDAVPLSLQRPTHHRDELDELAQAVNHLRTKLNIYDREIREEKSRYYALVENNPEAIWRCEIAQTITVASPQSQQADELQRYAVLAELNDIATHLTAAASRLNVIGGPWHQLYFLNPDLWQALVHNHYRLKDWISQFTDSQGRERVFSSSLTCLINNGEIKTIWGIAVEITQRVLAQRELENREQQLSLSQARLGEAQALAHMGHWVYKTLGDQLQVSDEFARIYGFDPIGDPPQTWVQLQQRIHPDDRETVLHQLSDPKTPSIGAEHRILWPSGEVRHVQATARKTVENNRVSTTFGIIMDITERRRAEEERKRSQQALIESEARMAEAQAIAHLGHWILDRKTQLLSCSDEFFRLFGHPPQSFRPTLADFFRQIHPDDRERISALVGALQGNALAHEYRIVRTDGAVRYMRGTMAPFYSGGRDSGRVFGISMDVTEHKLAESTAEAQHKQLVRADKLASLGTMVAGVAHEINNPNHLIQMNAELLDGFTRHLLELLEERLDEQEKSAQFNGMALFEIMHALPELLADVKDSSRRIDRIVKDLKDFSRPRDNAEFLAVNFNQVIDKTRTLLGSALDKRQLQLTYDLADDLPEIWGDSQRLEQVIVNLVTNAMDAVSGPEARILVRTYRRDACVICDVTDNGSGIAPEHLPHIFDPFFTTKQERGGTGLGLSISFRLLREHGGQLEALQAPGGGTTMRMQLPVKASPNKEFDA